MSQEDIDLFDALNNALHNPSKVESGEIQVPEGFDEVYQSLRTLTDFEQAARIDFDPDMATVEDYFYRGWKPPESYASFSHNSHGQLVYPPGFKKPRIDASYQDMRDLGFEPLFWNPAEQWKVSRMQGVRYREQMELVNALKQSGDDVIRANSDSQIPEGWRIPRIGPAFEGKTFGAFDDAGNPIAIKGRSWIVRNDVGNVLENVYGTRPDLGTVHVGGAEVDILNAIDWITFVPKRAKLVGSIFQQVDFANRQGIGAFSNAVDELSRGRPDKATLSLFKLPLSMWEMLDANLRPGSEGKILAKWDSTTPIMKDRIGVTPASISSSGLSQTDVTILPADMGDILREGLEEAGTLSPKLITRLVANIEGAMRRGLFQRFYPATIYADVTRNIAPMMIKMYPHETDARLSAMIAEAANIKWSSIPASMSAVQNRFIRETGTRVAFSMGENEGLLRQAFRAIPIRGKVPRLGIGQPPVVRTPTGPGRIAGARARLKERPQSIGEAIPLKINLQEQRFWGTHWIGAYMWLMTMASTIHFVTTGEVMPKERWSPISKDKWGPLPFGYNTKFAAPTLPGVARGGFDATLDLVGQMDTAFRILDPQSFVSSRTSVPVRAIINATNGENFYGQDTMTVGPGGMVSWTEQLVRDLFSPIGPGPVIEETIRQQIPGGDKLIPAGEPRLGIKGLLLQSGTGSNLRAESNTALWEQYEDSATTQEDRDRIVQELYLRDFVAFDRNPTFEQERTDPRTKTKEEWLRDRLLNRKIREREEAKSSGSSGTGEVQRVIPKN